MKRGKRYREIAGKVDRQKRYDLEEAMQLVKENSKANFDETVELVVCLGVDPKKADQRVRGTVVLPHGTGRSVRVLVLTKGEKESEAEEAGAEWVGSDEYLKKISEGWTDVDVIIATPDMMSSVGKLGRILGPRGLMPNPKSGTVTFDVAKAVKEAKAGKIEFRVDRGGNLHVPLGKVSFALEKLMDNAKAFLDAVIRARPPSAKGQYLRKIAISSTMGVGLKVDPAAARNVLKG